MALAGIILAALSAAAVVASLVYLGQQTKISAELTGTAVLANAMDQIDRVIAEFLTYPELRPYFYKGAELGDTVRPADRARIETIAELLADALEMGLESLSRIPEGAGDHADWEVSAIDMLGSSPALRECVRAYAWWPRMSALLAGQAPGA